MIGRSVVVGTLLLVAGFAVSQTAMMPDIDSLEESTCWSCHKPGAWEPAWTDALEVVSSEIVSNSANNQLEVTLRNPWAHEIPILITSMAAYPALADPQPSVLVGPWSEQIIAGPTAQEIVFDLDLPIEDANILATADSILGQVPIELRIVSVDAFAGKSYAYTPMEEDAERVFLGAEQLALAPAWQAIVTVPPTGPGNAGEIQVTLRGAITPQERVAVHGPLGPGETVNLRIDVPVTGSAWLSTYQHALYAHDDSSGATPNEDVIQKEFTFDWEQGQLAARTEVPAQTTPGMAPLLVLAMVTVIAAIRRR